MPPAACGTLSEVEDKLIIAALTLPPITMAPLPCESANVPTVKFVNAELVSAGEVLGARVTLPVLVRLTPPPDELAVKLTAPVLDNQISPVVV